MRCPDRGPWLLDRPVKPGDDSDFYIGPTKSVIADRRCVPRTGSRRWCVDQVEQEGMIDPERLGGHGTTLRWAGDDRRLRRRPRCSPPETSITARCCDPADVKALLRDRPAGHAGEIPRRSGRTPFACRLAGTGDQIGLVFGLEPRQRSATGFSALHVAQGGKQLGQLVRAETPRNRPGALDVVRQHG